MSRSAVLTERTLADVVYNAGILVVLMVTASRGADVHLAAICEFT